MTTQIHRLWKEMSSSISIAIECTEKEWNELLEVYKSRSIQSTIEWIEANYILLPGKTVRVRNK